MRRFKMAVALVVAISLVLSMAPGVFAAGYYNVNWIYAPEDVFEYVYDNPNPYGFIVSKMNDEDFTATTGLFTPDGMKIKMGDYGITDIDEKGLIYYNLSDYDDEKESYVSSSYVADIKGNVIIPEGKYDYISPINEDYISVKRYGKYAIANKKGERLTENVYDDIREVKGTIVVEIGDDVCLLDLDLNEVVPAGVHKSIVALNAKDRYLTYEYVDGKAEYRLYNLENEMVAEFIGKGVYDLKGDAIFVSDYNASTYGVYNYDGELIVEVKDLVGSNKNFLACKDEYYEIFICDYEGNIIYDYEVKSVNFYNSSDNYLVIYDDLGDCCVIDKEGNEITCWVEGDYRMLNDDIYVITWDDDEGFLDIGSIKTDDDYITGVEADYIHATANGTFFATSKWGEEGFEFFQLEYCDGEPVKVKVNDRGIHFDQKPIIQDGRTLVPVRNIFYALGATVKWDNETRTVTSELDGTTVKIVIDSKEMKVNGKTVELDVPAQIVNGRTLVPARAVSEAFGCTVEWDDDTRTVVIKK